MVGLDGIYDHFPLCHYEYGNSHRPHPLYSVLTIHRLTEETSSLSALWAHGRPHTRSHWPLLWPTAEFSRNSACPHKQNGSSHRKLVVFVVSAMSHYGPKPSWILLWASASNPDWDTAQAHNEWPSGKSWHMETKWGFHLGWFQTSRSLTAPAISQPYCLTKPRLLSDTQITAWSLSFPVSPLLFLCAFTNLYSEFQVCPLFGNWKYQCTVR